jgi:hypothetical protein
MPNELTRIPNKTQRIVSVLQECRLVTLMIETLCSSETLILTRATRRNIPEGGIHHSQRRENLKSYTISNLSYLFTGLLSDLTLP